MEEQAEDKIMKSIMELFKGDAAKFFGISKELISPVRTELIHINVTKKLDDWIFLADDDTYVHFEFQSTDKPNDLGRFMVSDAVLYANERKPIKTIVVYSSDIKSAVTELNAGSIKYSVDAFYMIMIDGDKTYNALKIKVNNGEQLTKQDLMSIVFMPLMKNSVDKATRMEHAIQLSKEIEDEEEQLQIQGMINLLADKFIKNLSQLSKVKELLSMTLIGEMIREDAIIKEKEETVRKALKKSMRIDDIAEITGLDKAKILLLQKELQAEASL